MREAGAATTLRATRAGPAAGRTTRRWKLELLLLSSFFVQSGLGQELNIQLDYDTASRLAGLAMTCIGKEFPNKPSHVLYNETDNGLPSELHPIFFGCFDWHSSVHGHWLLAKVANLFPEKEIVTNITSLFDSQFSEAKVKTEVDYFKRKDGPLFERTYGWAWLLKLQAELSSSKNEAFAKYANILKPLADHIVNLYLEFLPKLVYPIRVGEHSNTGFGFAFALDFARLEANNELSDLIVNVSRTFYQKDRKCPLSYEPSGSDFLSPCLHEADLMTRVISSSEDFTPWLNKFLPELFEDDFQLHPGQIRDRTDGKLVHLDGLNFSRAWALYNIAAKVTNAKLAERLRKIGDEHILTSMENVVGSHYAGSHWLASFLLHALEVRHSTME